MNTTKLGLWIVATVAMATLFAATQAQEVTPPTDGETAQIEAEGRGRFGRIANRVQRKEGKWEHKRGDIFKVSAEYFEDLSDTDKEALKAALEEHKEGTSREDFKDLSEEEKEAHRAERGDIIASYVDAEDISSGAWDAHVAEMEANHEAKKMEREESKAEKKEERKDGIVEKFVERVATMSEEEKDELLERIDVRAGFAIARIESSGMSEDKMSATILRVESLIEMIKTVLST